MRQLGRQFQLRSQAKSTAAAVSAGLPSNILNSAATEVTTLANGLRVASEVSIVFLSLLCIGERSCGVDIGYWIGVEIVDGERWFWYRCDSDMMLIPGRTWRNRDCGSVD